MSATLSFDTRTEYFPIELGNTWTYKYWDIVEEGIPTQRIISDSVLIDNKAYYELTYRDKYTAGSHLLFRADSIGRIFLRSGSKDKLWFDFTLSDSSKYKYIRAQDDTMIVLVRKNQTVQTSLAEFTNCTVFYFDNPNVYDDDIAYYFAPSIGIIKIRHSHWARELLAGYYFPKDSIKVSVENKEIKQEMPQGGHLKSFPNPFNSSVTIQFQISSPSEVKLIIYNIQGKPIETLVDEYKSTGEYSVVLNGNDYATGIYFACLVTSDYSEVKQLIYLR